MFFIGLMHLTYRLIVQEKERIYTFQDLLLKFPMNQCSKMSKHRDNKGIPTKLSIDEVS